MDVIAIQPVVGDPSIAEDIGTALDVFEDDTLKRLALRVGDPPRAASAAETRLGRAIGGPGLLGRACVPGRGVLLSRRLHVGAALLNFCDEHCR